MQQRLHGDCMGTAKFEVSILWSSIENVCEPLLYIVHLALLHNEYLL